MLTPKLRMPLLVLCQRLDPCRKGSEKRMERVRESDGECHGTSGCPYVCHCSQGASRTLLLLFLREIGQEDEGRAERQGRRGLCRKRKSSGNEERKKRKKEDGGEVADITSYGKPAPCCLLMPRLCLRLCSFSFSSVCTISDLPQRLLDIPRQCAPLCPALANTQRNDADG